ncbi:uncharacterized protein LOC107458560 isoform X1 [Arachis duranensis]|uniref:Uncharacterized protein LOC107458560 isoform X1 n=1 Tax=Arachis duranensis TaxID=130453 RepID=A0A6P5MKS7_ARADU|nr:uncharacterized protein LOC107458560 isoform X1 [Arachis duranensis]XP_052107632.1 uncharacterized protein LOC107458560 isoform X1 [Arachis duranensis]XP_052107633.1 uncharacterized protein LOC107458560 isoform X1 [Arachis duranensis]XP_052107634.1 uncharacterized protein LOC107458560 isoform X1 [Arachis duranensis]
MLLIKFILLILLIYTVYTLFKNIVGYLYFFIPKTTVEIKIKPQNAGTSFRNDAVVIETVTTPDSLQCGVDVHLETFRRHCFGSLKEARLIPWLPSWPVLVRRGTPPIGVGLTSRGFWTLHTNWAECLKWHIRSKWPKRPIRPKRLKRNTSTDYSSPHLPARLLHSTQTTVSTVISGDADCIPTGGVSFFSICGDEFSTIHGCIIFFFRGTTMAGKAEGSDHREPVNEQAVANIYAAMRSELNQIHSKITELEMEVSEHSLVVNAIQPLDPSRRCYRMIGGVLVERTVKEVLPAVLRNKEGLEEVISRLNEALEKKKKEIVEFEAKYKIRIRKADAEVKDESGRKEGTAQGVLVGPAGGSEA